MMTANEIYELLLNGVGRLPKTCDGLISGDGGRRVRRAATCHKVTLDSLEEAVKNGADMIVTHEPPFVNGNTPDENPVDAEKARRIAESGVAVYRFHDHAHLEPDYIHAAFIRATHLPVTSMTGEKLSLGIRHYELKEPTSAQKLAAICRDSLGAAYPRVAGDADHEVTSLVLALGGIGYDQIKLLTEPWCDLIVTGECNEVVDLEYVKDVRRLYGEKAVLLLGHYTAEYLGMRLVAERLCALGIEAFSVDSGEVWQ